VIADVMLGTFELEARDAGWFEDRAQMKRVVDAILGTPLGAILKFAGVHGETKPAADAEAVVDQIAIGRPGMYGITDGRPPKRAGVTLTITKHDLLIEARVFEPELAARRTTVLDDLTAIAVAVRGSGPFRGLSSGWIRPMSLKQVIYVPDRKRAAARARTDLGLRAAAVVDLIDVGFHRADDPLARPAEVELAGAPVPDGVHRDERDGVIVLRWIDDIGDKPALDAASEAHEDWIDRYLPPG
jgi:hypothetical protein